jgi:three-Cys-motif partner protein
MVAKKFHNRPFDQETRLKLDIFRGYVREWIPVFLLKRTFSRVCIYDFFAGPGYDSNHTPGSPVIIRDEVDRYLHDDTRPKAVGIDLKLYFNDNDKSNFEQLQLEVAGWPPPLPYNIQLENKDFIEAFQEELPSILDYQSANLMILDQFGVKYVTGDIFQQIIACPATDVIFFVSSNTIKRFISENNIRRYIPLNEEMIRVIDLKEIHRFICNEYYRRLIPTDKEYYLAPFSIKKEDGNIYGLIFGTGKLLGLEKFLKVCWDQDKVAGEANYAIDDDESLRKGQRSLFEEHNVFKKMDRFRGDLMELLRVRRDNRELYRFCLENGFLPKHINELLHELRTDGLVESTKPTGGSVPSRASYINWESYNSEEPQAFFSYKGVR